MLRRRFLAATGALGVALAGCARLPDRERPAPGLVRDFDFDTAEAQALTHPWSAFQAAQRHQHAWIDSLTRTGSGHAERFEVHADPGDVVNGQAYRSMMDVVDTNDGGVSVSEITGYPEVFWAFSCYWPTLAGTPGHASPVPGHPQVAVPAYEMFFELHERSNVNGSERGIDDVAQVSLISVMVRDGELQLRTGAGRFDWTGSGWRAPRWSMRRAGTTGRNDRVPVPIVKATGTDAALLTDAWLDVVLHVRFSEDADGLIELWAREAGQDFDDDPGLRVEGPTHRVVVGADGRTRSSADLDPETGTSGAYMHCGLYTGSPSWEDPVNSAHVVVLDDVRRHARLEDALGNWSGD